MEADFISDLDRTFSNVGTDTLWKRRIGKLELWISPLSFTGQEKVTAALENATAGLNIVGESKRVTLSNVIVGVNATDLREFRGGAPIFPSKGRDGKVVKVPLERYIYDKMASWGGDYIDDVYSVYADLMESHQKENLKEIKFENAKDPHVELQELERKAASLRAQLGLPKLVEQKEEGDEDAPTPEEIAEALAEEEAAEKRGEGKPEDFDPFRPVPQTKMEEQMAQPAPQAAPPEPQPPPGTPGPPPPRPPSAQPQPVMTMPAVLPAHLRRPMPDGPQAQTSSPERPHVAMPSVQNEVLDKPMERGARVRPPIDQPQGNLNPRFRAPAR